MKKINHTAPPNGNHSLTPYLAMLFAYLLPFLSSVHYGTKFTKEPPRTVFANLGSDATFHWKFAFGDQTDWEDFEEIIWGRTDNNDKLRDKFITVYEYGQNKKNTEIQARTLKSRLSVSGNVTQQGSNLVFMLRNVSRQDEKMTFGCTAVVWGEWFRSGPIQLDVQGKVHKQQIGYKFLMTRG